MSRSSGGCGWRRRRAGRGEPGRRDSVSCAPSRALRPRVKSPPRPCLGENIGPGTLAHFYSVRHRKRGNNTPKRKQSTLGVVVVLRKAREKVEPLQGTHPPTQDGIVGVVVPSSPKSLEKWQMSGRGFSAQLESWEETTWEEAEARDTVWYCSFIPQHRLFIFVSQSLERCLARGRTQMLFKAWSGYEFKYLSNE